MYRFRTSDTYTHVDCFRRIRIMNLKLWSSATTLRVTKSTVDPARLLGNNYHRKYYGQIIEQATDPATCLVKRRTLYVLDKVVGVTSGVSRRIRTWSTANNTRTHVRLTGDHGHKNPYIFTTALIRERSDGHSVGHDIHRVWGEADGFFLHHYVGRCNNDFGSLLLFLKLFELGIIISN